MFLDLCKSWQVWLSWPILVPVLTCTCDLYWFINPQHSLRREPWPNLFGSIQHGTGCIGLPFYLFSHLCHLTEGVRGHLQQSTSNVPVLANALYISLQRTSLYTDNSVSVEISIWRIIYMESPPCQTLWKRSQSMHSEPPCVVLIIVPFHLSLLYFPLFSAVYNLELISSYSFRTSC